MPYQNESSGSSLCALAEASAQFHWGTDVAEVRAAARELNRLCLNPDLVQQLEAKAVRMYRLAAPDRLLAAAA